MAERDSLPRDVPGWVHSDGTLCDEYLAPPASTPPGNGYWCTTHQMFVRHPDSPAAAPDGDPVSVTLAEAKRIADTLAFACRIPDKVPDFTACGGPAAEAYWAYFTPARIVSLLAAVGRVLELHRKQDKPVRSWDLDLRCAAHDWTKRVIRSFDAVRDCPDCRYTEYYACSHCRCPDDARPCPTVRAITAALTGQEAGDGLETRP